MNDVVSPRPARPMTRSEGAGGYVGQRALDLSVGAVSLLVTLPLVLVAALLVRVSSRGPVIYTQTRCGRGGKAFRIFKLRTMYHDCERATGAVWATRRDNRITPVGRVLRALHLDELPQLWNVLRGEMSLVGPRPERPEIMDRLEPFLPDYRRRLAVRPGMTGLAQIQLPADDSIDSVREKLKYDLAYTHAVSLSLDLRILWGTVVYLARFPYRAVRVAAGLPRPRPDGDAAIVIAGTAPFLSAGPLPTVNHQ